MTREPVFSIYQLPSDRRDFGPYEYRVLKDDRLFARYWHDYRGDDHGIEFVDGTSDALLLWRVTDFLGTHPRTLSDRAVSYLKQKAST